jgi:uncharacterized protein (DUF697 family)
VGAIRGAQRTSSADNTRSINDLQEGRVMAEELKTAPVVKSQEQRTTTIIRYHMLGAAGVSLLPIPIVDYVALTGIQINMLRQMAQVYSVPFFKDTVKNILSPLMGAAVPGLFGGPLALSMVKFIPWGGSILGMTAMPVLASATTYAVGKVFQQHFASGGTILTFNPEKVKAYYLQMFEEGKKIAAEPKAAEPTAAEPTAA